MIYSFCVLSVQEHLRTQSISARSLQLIRDLFSRLLIGNPRLHVSNGLFPRHRNRSISMTSLGPECVLSSLPLDLERRGQHSKQTLGVPHYYITSCKTRPVASEHSYVSFDREQVSCVSSDELDHRSFPKQRIR